MDVDELYALPLSDFVAARDALAKQRKAEGDVEAAAAVKALRRPSVVAWAVNQVARREPDVVTAAIEAGAAVAAALDAGDRGGLREATARRREAVGAATRAAVALVGAQHRDEIADTFEAASVDAAVAADVRAGRLTRGLAPTAVFAPLGDTPLPSPPALPAVDEEALRAARARAGAADETLKAARRALARAEAAAADAWAEVDRLSDPPGRATGTRRP